MGEDQSSASPLLLHLLGGLDAHFGDVTFEFCVVTAATEVMNRADCADNEPENDETYPMMVMMTTHWNSPLT